MTLSVACVLRSGGEYTPEHVMALRIAVEAHLPTPHRFVCISDGVAGFADFLTHGTGGRVQSRRPMWPGWWSKLELFRPGTFEGRVLYLDLDTVIVGDLSDLAGYAGDFAMLNDFLRPERPASGVMAWEAECDAAQAVWGAFARDPEQHIAEFRGGGDQEFIASVIFGREDRLQTLYPGQIVSYKVHCAGGVPDGARVVCAHGRPKPWDAEWTL